MRNSEAQKYARWSLAAAGLLAAVVAGVYLPNKGRTGPPENWPSQQRILPPLKKAPRL